VFDPLNSIFFVIGLIGAAWRRGPGSLFLVTILGVMLAPGMLSIDSPHYLRTSGAVAPIYTTWALGLGIARGKLAAAWSKRPDTKLLAVLVVVVPIAVATIRDGWGYFVTYATSPDMPASYNVEHAAAGQVLAASPIWKADRANVYLSDRYEQDRASVAAFLYPLLAPSDRPQWLDETSIGTFIPQNELVPLPLGPSLYIASGDARVIRGALGPAVKRETRLPVMGGGGIDVIEATPDPAAGSLPSLAGGPATLGGWLVLEGAANVSADGSTVSGRTIALKWKVAGQPTYRPSIFVHVEDSSGWLLAQADLEVQLPNAAWRPGQEIVTYHLLRMPAGTLPGRYNVSVGVYNKQTNARETPVVGGKPTTSVQPTTLVVDAPIVGAATVSRRIDQIVAPGLDVLGIDSLPAHVEAGTSLPLTIVWRTTADGLPNYVAEATIRTTTGETVGLWHGLVGDTDFGTSRWMKGTDGRQTIEIPIAATASGGVGLRVQVTPVAAASGSPLPVSFVDVGRFVVDPAQHDFTPPSPSNPLAVDFGKLARLIGTSGTERPIPVGKTFDLHLYWKSSQPNATRYTVFVHVLNTSDGIVAQRDEEPVHGGRPTTGWVTGEYIDDPHLLTIDRSTPPGVYRVEVGLYDPVTGTRLTAANGDDRAIIGEIRVVAP
jgi:hypothetical protein